MYRVYHVMDGDTMEGIASKFHTDVDTLHKLNDVDVIMPNMGLVVPKGKNEYFHTYIVKSGDNLYDIARQHGTSVELLAAINGLDKNKYIHPGQEIMVPKSDIHIHVTKDGESIQYIAKYLNVSLHSLVDENDKIYLLPGQILLHKKKEMH